MQKSVPELEFSDKMKKYGIAKNFFEEFEENIS